MLLLLNQELRLPSIALKWFSYDPLCEYALPEDDLTIAGLTVTLSPKSYVYVLVSKQFWCLCTLPEGVLLVLLWLLIQDLSALGLKELLHTV